MKNDKNSFLKLLICLLLIVIAFLMINIGILNGEVETVATKAINICLECIGIG